MIIYYRYVCSFIQGMTNAWLLHNLLIPTLEVQPEKLRVRVNPRKGIIDVRAVFFASRDAEFCIPGARFVDTKQNKNACVS